MFCVLEEALAGIIAMMVQGFYAWRILRLTQNYWLVAAVLVPSIAGGLGGIGTAIGVAIRPEFAGLQSLEPIVLTWLAGAAISDTIIAVTLVWHLYRSRTGYSRTDTMVSRIIQLTLSNGLLTASFALADIISYLITVRLCGCSLVDLTDRSCRPEVIILVLCKLLMSSESRLLINSALDC